MAKNNKKSAPQQAISLKTYIIQNARKLELFKCWEYADVSNAGMKQIVVARQKRNGSLIVGMYLVDYYCLGLKDTFYKEFEDIDDLKDSLLDKNNGKYTKIDANYAFNFIYGAIEFAEDLGLEPHKEFKVTEYILDDVDDVDFIDIEFGKNGRACFMPSPWDNVPPILATLDKTVGKGNYDYVGVLSDLFDGYEGDDIFEKIAQIQEEELSDEEFQYRIKEQELKFAKEYRILYMTLVYIAIFIDSELDLEDLEKRYKIDDKEVIEEISQKLSTKISALKKELSPILIAIVFENIIYFNGPEFVLLDEFTEALISFMKQDPNDVSPHIYELFTPFKIKRRMTLIQLCNTVSNKLFMIEDYFSINDFQKKRVANAVIELIGTYEEDEDIDDEWEEVADDLDNELFDFYDVDNYIPSINKDEMLTYIMNLD